MKILIVEDEAKTGDYLKQGLSEAGFTVDLVRNGLDGMQEGLGGGHDLLILDVNLPGLDGWQLLKALRAAGRDLPVLFLTARDQVEDRVRGYIASQVWDMNFDSDTNVVEVAIRRLRAKIDDDFTPRLIHTLRGMGYVMEIR